MAKERIDTLLVSRGFAPSRARAQARVLAGDVIVDDHRVDKPGTQVRVDATIRLRGDDLPWVSRGGVKLAAALDAFAINPAGRVAVDVGASTGGFTDVLLQHGAALVHAIDVGWGQLHEKLRQDERVRNLERTHIVKLPPRSLEPVPSLAVIDVSFISLRQVLPAVVRQLGGPGAIVVALIKPQFEVGREHVGKGGIVKNATARAAALNDVLAAAKDLGLAHQGTIDSPIAGADGNVEYLTRFDVVDAAT